MSVDHIHGGLPCGTHRTYKLGCREFDALLARSAGHCEACGIPTEESGLQQLIIDHDHRYGFEAVRGLICSSCNQRLGGMEHSAPVGERHYIPEFAEYIRKAWFVQRSRLALLQEPDPDAPDQDWVTRSVLIFVRRLTTATGQQPEVTVYRTDAPGALQLRAMVRHVTADHAAIECSTRLVVRNASQQEIEIESIRVRHYHVDDWFDGIPTAVKHIKEERAFHAERRAQTVAAQEEFYAKWRAEREAKKEAPSPNVERVILDRFKGGVQFSSRDVMEASGCGLNTAHRTVKAMMASGAIRPDGVGPKVSSMGRAPAVYVVVPS
ncbi:endonuclease domain-containing protein [Streptomyces sp. NPDC002088]|uniref:endonuclease domain-containing protein n=1 Tax=Streptomyces sp. NPDC002088 TaxID=3154665 RepID=UPI003329F242